MLEEGDLVLVKQTTWKGRHKIHDKWEDEEYQVMGQPTLVFLCILSRALQGVDLRSFLGICYCPCNRESDKKVG